MPAFLADENFNGDIVRGLFLRRPNLDLIRAQDIGLAGASDPSVLEWAARHNRVLLTHHVQTMIGFAFARVRRGENMPGVLVVPAIAPLGPSIEEILLVADVSMESEWRDQVRYVNV